MFGKNLKHLRKEKDLNQADIAEIVGKGDGTISNWEKGSAEPSFSEINEISKFFGIPMNDMLFVDLSIVHLSSDEKATKKTAKSPPKSPPISPPNVVEEPKIDYPAKPESQEKLIKTLEDLVADKSEIIAILKKEIQELKDANKILEQANGKPGESQVASSSK